MIQSIDDINYKRTLLTATTTTTTKNIKRENVISEKKKSRFSFIHYNICRQSLSCLVYLSSCLLFWIDSLHERLVYYFVVVVAPLLLCTIIISWIMDETPWPVASGSNVFQYMLNYYTMKMFRFFVFVCWTFRFYRQAKSMPRISINTEFKIILFPPCTISNSI